MDYLRFMRIFWDLWDFSGIYWTSVRDFFK